MHAKIPQAESALWIHVIEIRLECDHEGLHRPVFGTGLGSGCLRIASNCCAVKPYRSCRTGHDDVEGQAMGEGIRRPPRPPLPSSV